MIFIIFVFQIVKKSMMGAFGEDPGALENAGQSLDDILNQFDNFQVDEDARRLFGSPSLREVLTLF